MSLRVVVTRPAAESARWVDALRGRGFDAIDLPLVAIGPAADTAALAASAKELPLVRAAMFVSGNAVRGFLASLGAPWPEPTRAWATGPGTRSALVEGGVPEGCIDSPPPGAERFDSETLWSLVSGQVRRGDRVLLVRGADGEAAEASGRDWLSARLSAAGARVSSVAAYSRHVPAWSPDERALALQALRDAAWIFSSSQSVDHLRQLVPGASFDGARAVATHPRIAQAARHAGFGVVRESRGTLDAVAATLESFR